ncbi:TetR/AcrR family transcriptional regulator [Actinosynnema sp. NPDC020468]|uniref:TetR/AcrR family transcriptional regulator n=1 Tax=Actinosynnema sp. NPDC020468 TaxID=3154488 RepID=UPI0033FC0C33
MTAQPRPGRRPGRPPSLTRDDVARAALDEGMENLSMPSVARRLGVGHSTLYRYVHDRDDLVLAALDLAMREFSWPPADLPWRELLTAFVDALWRFLAGSPGLAEAVWTAPGLPPGATVLMTGYRVRLRAEGLSEQDAMVAIDLVADLTVATEIGVRGLDRVFDTPRGRRSLREIYLLAWPEMGDETFRGRGWLNEKLDILLDGLASRVGPPVPVPAPVCAPPAVPGRAEVVAQGRALAREEGLAAVTLRAVGRRVGVDPTTLPAVVGDRDGLVVAMLDAVAEEIEPPPAAAEPRAELLAVSWTVYEVLRGDPWAVAALSVDGLAGPLILPLVDRVVTAFRAAGVVEIADAARILWSHLFGAVLSATNPDDESFGTRMAAEVVPALARRGAEAHDDRARLGLSIVVDGLLDRLATPPATPTASTPPRRPARRTSG